MMFIAIGIPFGLIYNHLYYPHRLTEYLEAAAVGLLCGLFIGSLEEFYLRKRFSRVPFYIVLLSRTFIYSILISLILTAVLSIEIAFDMQVSYGNAFIIYLYGPDYQRDLLFSLVLVFILLFIVQVIQLFGVGNFFRLVYGTYHRAKEVSKVFLFIDLKDSTHLAETLSNQDYSDFIKDFFYFISDAIAQFGGEVYQYVGDEIVVSWTAKSRDTRSISCFFLMKQIIYKNHDHFVNKYGIVPHFKAGLHYGNVIVTEVGKIQRAIVYHGDVMNTTSRIEGKCNDLGQDLLLSSHALEFLEPADKYDVIEKGKIVLKGKHKELGLYGVEPKTT